MTYELAFQELQELVAQLQTGDTSVDDLSEKAQRAAELIAFCKEKLRETEAQVQGLFEVETS